MDTGGTGRQAAGTDPGLAAVQPFLAGPLSVWIDGRPAVAAGGESFDLIDPSTARSIARCQLATEREVDLAATAARRAFDAGWGTTPAAERSRILLALADLVERHAQEIATLDAINCGTPRHVLAGASVPLFVDFLRYYAGWPTKIEGAVLPASPPRQRRPGAGFLSYTTRDPIGVVGAILPWNAPFGMLAMKLAPALAAGCTLVVKPSELTPLSALYFGTLAEAAGLPPGVVNVVPGRGTPVGEAMLRHEQIDKIAFTGSTAVGKHIVRTAAESLKRVTLELGGKSPFVVFPDVDVAAVAGEAARAAFFLTGQNCKAATRLYVHESVYREFVDALVAATRRLRVGPSLDPASQLGPLISAGHLARVRGYVDDGVREGARVVFQGTAPDGPGHFLAPVIFDQADRGLRIVREEIFGPVACVQRFSDRQLPELVADINGTIYGLSGSVWTNDIDRALTLVAAIDAGQVGVNCHAPMDAALPFGGNRQSGWGRELGREGLEPYLKTKATTIVFNSRLRP